MLVLKGPYKGFCLPWVSFLPLKAETWSGDTSLKTLKFPERPQRAHFEGATVEAISLLSPLIVMED